MVSPTSIDNILLSFPYVFIINFHIFMPNYYLSTNFFHFCLYFYFFIFWILIFIYIYIFPSISYLFYLFLSIFLSISDLCHQERPTSPMTDPCPSFSLSLSLSSWISLVPSSVCFSHSPYPPGSVFLVVSSLSLCRCVYQSASLSFSMPSSDVLQDLQASTCDE